MALQRYTRAVDGTIPVPALLYDDEELLASQDNTGIYDGPQKSLDHQVGTIHVTTHRLFYIDIRHPLSRSFTMDLSYVNRTEYYAGLFKSSPKVTVHLAAGNVAISSLTADREVESAFESWECEVCGNRNPPGLSPTAARICTLCGVPRNLVPVSAASTPTRVSSPHQGHISSSLPSSAFPSTFFSSTSSSSHPPPPPGPPPPPAHQPSSIACPTCTFLNHPSMRFCEMCNTPLPRITPSQAATDAPPTLTKSAPSTRPVSPDVGDEDSPTVHLIKLSFRKGGDKPFYAVLKRSLMGKAWEGKAIGKGRADASAIDVVFNPNPGRSGIHGIMRTVETSAQNTATDMNDALKDLEALMVKAKDMVRLAAELNERLTASSTTTTTTSTTSARPSTPSLVPPVSSSPSPSPSMYSTTTLVPSTEPEEATFIRSSLSQLGLQMSNTPVTLDMIRDERRWVEELAQELARVLQGSKDDDGPSGRRGTRDSGMMRERGIVALDEVWGGWNRARGVALIPPSTFLLVLPHLPFCTSPPIRSRTFISGLSVLHTPPYTHAAFTSRLASLLALTGPKTTVEVAHEESITIGLAGEMIGAVEADGEVCRDDGSTSIRGGGSGVGAELKWWANVFTDFVWDGEE